MDQPTDSIKGIGDMLTPEEAAELLGVKSPTLQLYRIKGTGPAFFKLGKRIFYSRADIAAYIQSQRKVA